VFSISSHDVSTPPFRGSASGALWDHNSYPHIHASFVYLLGFIPDIDLLFQISHSTCLPLPIFMLIYSTPISKPLNSSTKQIYELSIPGKPPNQNTDFGYLNDHPSCSHEPSWIQRTRRLER
jgi:hypothetical protein